MPSHDHLMALLAGRVQCSFVDFVGFDAFQNVRISLSLLHCYGLVHVQNEQLKRLGEFCVIAILELTLL